MTPGFPTRPTDFEADHRLLVFDVVTEREAECLTTLRRTGDTRQILVVLPGGERISATSKVDFEDALSKIRGELERRGLLLLCNRFRMDAFVSSMSRQMSDGLRCYLVEARVPVNPSRLVDAVGPAPRESVVLASEAAVFIEDWIAGFDD